MGCDAVKRKQEIERELLSVSSNGSNGLRPRVSQKPIHPGVILSVSSNGSNGLRRRPRPPLRPVPHHFQYPRTDRMGCDRLELEKRITDTVPFSILERIEWAATAKTWLESMRYYYLSVSSNGSNGLRRETFMRQAIRDLAFSILERIEWAATHRRVCLPRRRPQLSVSSNGSNGLRPKSRYS